MKPEPLIVGLDVGTTKICCIVGEPDSEGGINVIGVGAAPSRGLDRGVVANIESTIESIKEAVEQAEVMCGRELSDVYIGISGSHIAGMTSKGMVVIRDREIRETDIHRVVDAARAVNIPADREVVHILPQEFIVDDQDGIREPIGMSGLRLEAKVYIVTAAVTSAQNLIRCANRNGLHVSDIVLQQLASAEACLTQDEKELGVAVVDIGGGTTDIAIFTEGTLKYTSVVSLGGNHLTSDVSVGMRTPARHAERIKRKYGIAHVDAVSADEMIDVPSVGGRPPRSEPRAELARIIQARVEEILCAVAYQIEESGYRDLLAGGIVFTGGTSQLEGLVEYAEVITGLPCRLGRPRNVKGLADIVASPQYSTGVGLMLYGLKYDGADRFRSRDGGMFRRVRTRMSEWFSELMAAMF
ncbi:MAG: cell division protein FtsA [Candidatus Dadabacteria bacterium]|nr:MAG: cell division protein FtsA [Candidatus Dadabacteria bacterium]